uniref:HTH psq-type domain-containing protein n=1 Tax=Cynoglossus semilaevis TaxID=244447 RepID=A0A3P8W2G4_CYNSE
ACHVGATTGSRQRKMLSIGDKVKLLDMLNESKSYAAVGRHYGINESSVRSIKKEEKNIEAMQMMKGKFLYYFISTCIGHTENALQYKKE